jgi:hypothetical protein
MNSAVRFCTTWEFSHSELVFRAKQVEAANKKNVKLGRGGGIHMESKKSVISGTKGKFKP